MNLSRFYAAWTAIGSRTPASQQRRSLTLRRSCSIMFLRCCGAGDVEMAPSSLQMMECPMPQPKDDLSRSLVALDQHTTLIAVVELSLSTWLVGGMIPGIARDPLKKLVPDEEGLLKLLHRWRYEAIKAGHKIARMAVAFEAGRDGFWLRDRGIEAYVIHPTSIPVSREQRRAKTDRLDIGLLKRSFLGWLRGEKKHCSMAAIPTLEQKERNALPASASNWLISAQVSSTE
jgi:hypothetical protein